VVKVEDKENDEINIDAMNEDEEEIRIKVKLNLIKKNYNLFTQEEIESVKKEE
jgi:CRISPR/Cas system endoribonuclease Cas6 (RAMP superfamily)